MYRCGIPTIGLYLLNEATQSDISLQLPVTLESITKHKKPPAVAGGFLYRIT